MSTSMRERVLVRVQKDPRPTSADALEQSPHGDLGGFIPRSRGLLIIERFIAARGSARPERPQISSKFRPFAPPPQLLIKLSRKSGPPQHKTLNPEPARQRDGRRSRGRLNSRGSGADRSPRSTQKRPPPANPTRPMTRPPPAPRAPPESSRTGARIL